MIRLALQVLWPAFLMAGALTGLIFAVVDPGSLQWFGGEAVGGSRQAVYAVTFSICWGATAVSGALTALLLREPQ